MKNDTIAEIGIDNQGRLYIVPAVQKFRYIWREAMEVHWEERRSRLYGAELKNYEGSWGYLEWFHQIIKAAMEQGINLSITEGTKWLDISSNLKNDIIHSINIDGFNKKS